MKFRAANDKEAKKIGLAGRETLATPLVLVCTDETKKLYEVRDNADDPSVRIVGTAQQSLAMNPATFRTLPSRLGISRAELCRRLGIAPNSGTAYAQGRQPVPRVVALAAAAVAHGLEPYGEEPEAGKGNRT